MSCLGKKNPSRNQPSNTSSAHVFLYRQAAGKDRTWRCDKSVSGRIVKCVPEYRYRAISWLVKKLQRWGERGERGERLCARTSHSILQIEPVRRWRMYQCCQKKRRRCYCNIKGWRCIPPGELQAKGRYLLLFFSQIGVSSVQRKGAKERSRPCLSLRVANVTRRVDTNRTAKKPMNEVSTFVMASCCRVSVSHYPRAGPFIWRSKAIALSLFVHPF